MSSTNPVEEVRLSGGSSGGSNPTTVTSTTILLSPSAGVYTEVLAVNPNRTSAIITTSQQGNGTLFLANNSNPVTPGGLSQGGYAIKVTNTGAVWLSYQYGGGIVTVWEETGATPSSAGGGIEVSSISSSLTPLYTNINGIVSVSPNEQTYNNTYSGITGSGIVGQLSALGYTQAQLLVNITSVSGTTPSITFTFEEYMQDGAIYVPTTYATSPLTATGQVILNIPVCGSAYCTIAWTVSGTTPSFDFTEQITFKP